MAFELLTPTAAKLNSVTPRKEMHGDEPVSAITLALAITGPNTLLDAIDGGKLRNALYMPVPAQDQLPGVEVSTPLLRTRLIETLQLNGALEGWTVTIEHGITDETNIVLGCSKLDKFRVKPMEGGSVELAFRIGTSDIGEDEAGALFGMLGQECMVQIKAPAIATGPVIDGSTEAFERDHPKDERQADLLDSDPTDTFLSQHGSNAAEVDQ